jgi:hypothetical protein
MKQLNIKKEGLKIDLDYTSDTPESEIFKSPIKSIKSSLSFVPGEQLGFTVGSRDVGNPLSLKLFYSLEATEEGTSVKRTMDAVKYRYSEIQQHLQVFVQEAANRIKRQLNGEPDYVMYLDSMEDASRNLATDFQKVFSKAKVVKIPKTLFDNAFFAVDWEKYGRASDKLKADIMGMVAGLNNRTKEIEFTDRIDFEALSTELEKNRTEDPNRRALTVISGKKRIEVMSVEDIKRLQLARELEFPVTVEYKPKFSISKSVGYGGARNALVGKYSTREDKMFYPTYEDYLNSTNGISAKDLTKGQILLNTVAKNDVKLLIVDENVHSGADFRYIFEELNSILNGENEEILTLADTLKLARRGLRNISYENKLSKISKEEEQAICVVLGLKSKELPSHFREMMNKPPKYAKDFIERMKNNGAEGIRNLQMGLNDTVQAVARFDEKIIGYTLYKISDSDVSNVQIDRDIEFNPTDKDASLGIYGRRRIRMDAREVEKTGKARKNA